MRQKWLVGVCGSTGASSGSFDGQTVKTRNLIDGLKSALGDEQVVYINTHYWKTRPIHTFVSCVKLCIGCKKIIVMPAQRGLRIFLPIFVCLKKFLKYDLYYSVIGGWLPDILRNNAWLRRMCQQVTIIFPETRVLSDKLNELGITNTVVIPTAKKLNVEKEVNLNISETRELIFFSRVMREKGIFDLIDVVKHINEGRTSPLCKLDIYGMIAEKDVEQFQLEQESFPTYIRYMGVARPENSVTIMKPYYLHLFPTRFKTEGLPSSIIDAMCAGVPTLATEWNSANEFIENGINGIICKFDDYNDLKKALEYALENPGKIYKMKKVCLKDANKYSIDSVIAKTIAAMGLTEYENN